MRDPQCGGSGTGKTLEAPGGTPRTEVLGSGLQRRQRAAPPEHHRQCPSAGRRHPAAGSAWELPSESGPARAHPLQLAQGLASRVVPAGRTAAA